MSRAQTKRVFLGLLLAFSVASCSDDSSGDDDSAPSDGSIPTPGSDAGKDASVGPNIDAATDAGGPGVDANVVVDGGNKALVSCLERPGLPTPPTAATLPCELIPPGVSL